MSDVVEQKKKPRKWVAFLPLAVCVALLAGFAVPLFTGADDSVIPSALIGKSAPHTDLAPITGLMRDGVPVPGLDSAGFKGKLTLVNVWASWCAPCREEQPLMMQIARDPRIRVVGPNYKDEPENARRFLGDLGNPFVAVGSDRTGRSAIEWGVYGVPETYLVGPDGTILYKHVGPFTPESVQGELMPEIAKFSGKAS